MTYEISQKQIDDFRPTRLYIKEHSVTKLKYFGKTVREDFENYLGSGVYWTRHLKTHGAEYVKTIWSKVFTDIYDLVEFAMFFSEYNDIIKSESWANLVDENGLGKYYCYNDEDTRQKMSISHKGKDSFVDKNGISFFISCDDPRVISGELISIRKNKPTQQSNYIVDGKILKLKTDDHRILSGEAININTGKAVYTNGIDTIQLDINDSRVISGEFKHTSTGKSNYTDGLTTIMLQKDDPRVISGEFKHISTGKTTYTNGTITLMLQKDDPRVISGEFKHNNTGVATYKNSEGVVLKLANNDPRVISGEFKHTSLGVKIKSPYTDGHKTISMLPDDPRVISGEFKHINAGRISAKKGKCTYINENGDKKFLFPTDPEVLSGEFIKSSKTKINSPIDITLFQ